MITDSIGSLGPPGDLSTLGEDVLEYTGQNAHLAIKIAGTIRAVNDKSCIKTANGLKSYFQTKSVTVTCSDCDNGCKGKCDIKCTDKCSESCGGGNSSGGSLLFPTSSSHRERTDTYTIAAKVKKGNTVYDVITKVSSKVIKTKPSN